MKSRSFFNPGGDLIADRYAPLRDLIGLMSAQTQAHICIHDISGVLNADPLRLEAANLFHSKDFCTAAKASPKGYRMCIRCKMLANRKAVTGKELFHAYCPYGLYEIAKPVVIDGRTQCILYIGNLIFDREETARRVRRTCRITKSPEEAVLSHLKDAQVISSPEFHIRLAGLIESYIRLLHEKFPSDEADGNQLHWAVRSLQSYIDLNYNQNLSLTKVAKLYFINEKYVGRLFRQQTGSTFHEYLNLVRLEKSATLLADTRIKIIAVALACGFQNVTYFNRVFHRRFGVPPAEYRIRHGNH